MTRTDYLVVGGGFYGCCLALSLRPISERITVIEAEPELLTRASRANQARIHTGFHYPRSALTAVKSLTLHRRFLDDFSDAVIDDFQMLYAIAKRKSLVSSKRFYQMFRGMGAPIKTATPSQAALFNPHTVDAVFACTEYAFDYTRLSGLLNTRLRSANIDVRLATRVLSIEEHSSGVTACLSDGTEVEAAMVFNATYSQINHLLYTARLPQVRLKHELAEIALVEPPPQLCGFGVTVMDGPFISIMPFPAEDLYSLTHVRYTPHFSWYDSETELRPDEILNSYCPESRYRHMVLDGQKYLPCLSDCHWLRSLYEVKTLLPINEQDDGRPILYRRRPDNSRVISVLGGKIDNIYDLTALVKSDLFRQGQNANRTIHPDTDGLRRTA